MRTFASTLIASSLLWITGFCSAEDQPLLALVRLTLQQPEPPDSPGSAGEFRALGVEAGVYFSVPGRTVVGVDAKQSQVTLKSDDGTKLPLRNRFDGDLFAVSLYDGREKGVITFGSESSPEKSCTKLSLSGTLVFTVGKDFKTEDQELNVVDDGQVKLGPVEATINHINEGANRQMIQFRSRESFDKISKIEFLDGQGNVVQSSFSGSSELSSLPKTYVTTYSVNSGAKKLKVRVTHFSQLESVTAPIQLEFGLGL